MPELTDLISDIESLFSSRSTVEPSETDLQIFLDNVKQAVTSTFSRNNSVEEKRDKIRMSNLGKPDRQLWYEINSEDEEIKDLPYDLLLKFLYGSILEELLVLICKTAGHEVTDQQKEHDISGIKGHQDARVDGVVVDFKSASGFSFKKFKDQSLFDNDPFGYIAQLSAYAYANGVDNAAFIVIDKQSGEIAIMPVHALEMIDVKNRIDTIKNVIKSDIPPAKCYEAVPEGKSGNMKLATGCHYCFFKEKCWQDANDGRGLRAFMYSNGLKYFTQVRQEPRVAEQLL